MTNTLAQSLKRQSELMVASIDDLHVKANRIALQSLYVSARAEFGDRVAGLKLTDVHGFPLRFDVDIVDADQDDITFGENSVPLSEVPWVGCDNPSIEAAFSRFAQIQYDFNHFTLYPTREPLEGGVEVDEGRSVIFMTHCETLRPGKLKS